MDAFKTNVMSKIRATISLINTDLLSYLEDHPKKKPQVLHVAVNKSFKNQLSSCIVSGSQWEYAVIPARRIKNPSMTFLFQLITLW
jgi:hypothetical protein